MSLIVQWDIKTIAQNQIDIATTEIAPLVKEAPKNPKVI